MTLLAENAEILQAMVESGVDMASESTVDFIAIFDDQESAETFAEKMAADGFEVDTLPPDEEENVWEVTVTRELMLTAEAITEIEEKIEALAESLGGESDGWGVLDE